MKRIETVYLYVRIPSVFDNELSEKLVSVEQRDGANQLVARVLFKDDTPNLSRALNAVGLNTPSLAANAHREDIREFGTIDTGSTVCRVTLSRVGVMGSYPDEELLAVTHDGLTTLLPDTTMLPMLTKLGAVEQPQRYFHNTEDLWKAFDRVERG